MSALTELGPHGTFIWAAYAVFFVVLAGLAAWIAADEAYQQRLLSELEAQGVRRRSAAKPAAEAKPGTAAKPRSRKPGTRTAKRPRKPKSEP